MERFIREYSWQSRHPIATAVITFALFTGAAIVVGILTICFTQPKKSGMVALCYMFDIEVT
jgi:hypothetical protein